MSNSLLSEIWDVFPTIVGTYAERLGTPHLTYLHLRLLQAAQLTQPIKTKLSDLKCCNSCKSSWHLDSTSARFADISPLILCLASVLALHHLHNVTRLDLGWYASSSSSTSSPSPSPSSSSAAAASAASTSASFHYHSCIIALCSAPVWIHKARLPRDVHTETDGLVGSRIHSDSNLTTIQNGPARSLALFGEIDALLWLRWTEHTLW